MKEISLVDEISVRPFLRWAGGKTWLIKHLKKIKNSNFNCYHEAFLGGGATYFYLRPKSHSYLSDLNGELIETYQAVRDGVEDVIDKLQSFKNDEESYYVARDTIYDSSVERAAQFIYLNQTSFNGIYRVNLKGKYNVPFGFRKKEFIDVETLRNASLALADTSLFQSDFYSILENVKSRDLVFLDPPYTVSHNNNGFIKYNEKIFSLGDQHRLSNLIDEIKRKGAHYILTNAAHATIDEIFGKGDTKIELNRGSTIGGKEAERGQTSEYVFTNIIL